MASLILFNKPFGVLSQFTDERAGPARPTLADFIDFPGVYPAEGEPDETALVRLRQGVQLKDGLTRPAKVERLPDPTIWPRDPPIRYRKSVPDSWLKLTISEGRNRQVRRMTAAVGYPTLRLVRWSIGEWTLDGIEPGKWRQVPAVLSQR